MGSAECKCEYLAVETALNAAREETEEESADKKDLWMLYQLLGICGGSFSDILLFVHPFVFTEDGHWESDNNYNKKLTFWNLRFFYPSSGIPWQEEYGCQNK